MFPLQPVSEQHFRMKFVQKTRVGFELLKNPIPVPIELKNKPIADENEVIGVSQFTLSPRE